MNDVHKFPKIYVHPSGRWGLSPGEGYILINDGDDLREVPEELELIFYGNNVLAVFNDKTTQAAFKTGIEFGAQGDDDVRVSKASENGTYMCWAKCWDGDGCVELHDYRN